MPVVLLIRHGRTGSNAAGVLAGRSPGVRLDETGEQQVARLAERMRGIRLARLVTSPLERCVQTAKELGEVDAVDGRLQECDYGAWTGRPLSELRRLKLWKVVQEHPSGAVFPQGESLREMQSRAVAAVREHDEHVLAEHGASAVWAAVSHGDVIKSIVADALGMHLDQFQRIVADPASVTAISYTERRPFVLRLNDTGQDLTPLAGARRARRRRPSSDAAVGGGAG
ncbi:MSMEG_4193 family putative phosphomutase [Phytoactinopolyspora halotolerans]|uniref:MSMEG_4193 family putative phosphomutase n=1 Tax=Phytoactinopolyspora halotolerans TaxID=1981512 RepID=A0A6L9S848_9ACTN|nr:MSMEG_4193 family putative phosphomutase [Phytoactinopolyspora halotolerans]NEE01299.1 MSMEG_4193 family putative phosphomutase [Phytoactinopolyspora halotolerans]